MDISVIKVCARDSASLTCEIPLDLYEAFTRPKSYPENYNQIHKTLWGKYYERFLRPPKRSLYVFENALVLNYGTIVTAKGELIAESIIHSRREEREWRNFIRVSKGRFTYEYDGDIGKSQDKVISTGKPGTGNYGHWIWEIIPRIVVAKRLPQFKEHKILIHAKTQKVIHAITQIFEFFGIDESELLWRDDSPCEYSEVVFPSLWTIHPFVAAPDIGKFWENAVAPLVKDIPATRKLFVARNKPEGRRLINEEAVRDLLEPQGYEWCYPASYSFIDQIKLFASAKSIVGIAGAGMTNMVFAPKNIPVVMLAPEAMPCLFFFHISTQRQQAFSLLFGTGEAAKKNNPLAAFAVELNDLKNVLSNYPEN